MRFSLSSLPHGCLLSWPRLLVAVKLNLAKYSLVILSPIYCFFDAAYLCFFPSLLFILLYVWLFTPDLLYLWFSSTRVSPDTYPFLLLAIDMNLHQCLHILYQYWNRTLADFLPNLNFKPCVHSFKQCPVLANTPAVCPNLTKTFNKYHQ